MNSGSQSSSKHFRMTANSLETTQRLGRSIGRNINSGITIVLAGDLGSGKTSFAQGLAAGLGVPDNYYVTSPTYTLINEYPGRIRLFHIDLYRIGNIDELDDLGIDEIFDGSSVVAIEWADKLVETFLSEYLTIELKIIDDTSREIHITARGPDAETLFKKIDKKKFQ